MYKILTIFPMLYAAAAAKSFQSCPTLCDPMDGSPPGSLVPGILQARTLEWVARVIVSPIVYFMHSSLYLLIPTPIFFPFFSLVTTSLFSNMWVCLFFFIFTSLFDFLKILHVSDNIQCLSFSFWLILQSIDFVQSIHVVVNGRISFFFMAE